MSEKPKDLVVEQLMECMERVRMAKSDWHSELKALIADRLAANARIAELEGRNTFLEQYTPKTNLDLMADLRGQEDELISLRAELARLKAEGEGWLPIESYDGPDKRSVLVYCSYRKNTCTAYIEAGIWFHFAAGLNRLTEQPTHYRPLPPAPTDREVRG